MKRIEFSLKEVEKMLLKDWTVKKIAEYYGCSRNSVSIFLKQNNLISNKRKKEEENKKICSYEKLYNLYILEKKSTKEIADICGITKDVVLNYLHRYNIPLRDNSHARQYYNIDENYFNKIDTLNKSYILGFICADGWITNTNRFGVVVKKDDKEVIFFIKKELQSEHPIFYTEKTNSIGISITNKQLVNDLKKIGIVPNKSLILDISKIIQNAKLNNEQIKAFLLGYFDGDGGFTKSKPTKKYPTIQFSSNITGTYETCNYYFNYFKKVGFFTKRHNDEKNNYTYRIGGRNLIKTSFEKLYEIKDDIDFFFKRKYDIFKEC